MSKEVENKETLEYIDVSQGQFRAVILGTTPLICNAMSSKVHKELLFPAAKKSAKEKEASLKHEPLTEYRNSIYSSISEDAPTKIVVPAVCFKKAIMHAAVDLPGVTKAQMGRLISVEGMESTDQVSIYGIPEMMMAVTRLQNVARTPDIRTRAILPSWCCEILVKYTEPMLKGPILSKMLAAAGIINGLGDWRIQKGSGNYGCFSLVEEGNPQVKILKDGGDRQAQIEAFENPVPYNSETEELMSWYDVEVRRRGFKEVG